ncbi:Serine/threonine-protein kinase mos OS=Asterina pectinifera GN=mos PE=1 SV=1 [Rhizoctonia solani AG-1 IB]|uniref:Serine/threonine-protein kinase mos n=1 Tax=Thanatephorus cucumeris (strain AG1-IB / isolate 7/3/14) TaxID=1108050 RepID=A0A0B7F7P9_THACB|nr:Serine/threonine-protein kinase mos OS=Asterina pectinifera GN=mos PE=1 SV=1 [Rhizoctonia solani AG-1 IB]
MFSALRVLHVLIHRSSRAGEINLVLFVNLVQCCNLPPRHTMSRIYTSPLWSGMLGTTNDITKLVQINRSGQDIYEEAGLGGSADIFSGKYVKQDGVVVKVAIKSIRAYNLDKDTNIQINRLEKKLARELEIWRNLSGGNNIVELLGVMTGIGPLPSLVCEFCPWNLQDYLERKTPPPRHTKMMADTLRGLSYMHGLGSGPIAHGDIKLSNILVNSDETALICDFGRSRQPNDFPSEIILSNSSPFAGTVRYMSPELLVPASAKPSPAADMWAYGCVALEILCRIHPYNETTSDVVVADLIRSGRLPSDRPSGPRGSLINDTLWSVLSSCWQAQDWRPTAQGFLEELNRMVHSGEVPSSPIPMDLFTTVDNEPIPPWPSEVKDLEDQINSATLAVRSRSLRSTVWRARTTTDRPIIVKVPRLNASLDNHARHDHLEIVFRKVASTRHGVHHPNIIDFLGITSGFSPHEGLVFESCYQWTLAEYRIKRIVVQDEYTRSTDPYPTSHSLMYDILEGLKYIHGYPIPIAHGDLTPDNISVDDYGRAKISLMSFGRILTALTPDAAVTATVESVLSFRWMSPELIVSNKPQPTTESDMWTFGCVCFWLITLQGPYDLIDRDDLAGSEIVRGHPPATLSYDYHRDSWTTNGLWNAIAQCWRQAPLQRPSANDFMKLLVQLEGRKIDWLPINVVDLAGKVRFVSSARQDNNQVARHVSLWRRFDHNNSQVLEEVNIKMAFYEATYTPKWYSKSTRVVIKAGFGFEPKTNAVEALYSTIQHEVALMSQIEHPCIQKLFGIDSSPSHTHLPDMVLEPLSQVTFQTLLSQGETNRTESLQILRDVASAVTYLHEHTGGSIAHGDIQPANVFILSGGRAKLANFTCAFQYFSSQPASAGQWSEALSAPLQPSLYLSPESCSPVAFPTLAGDVWSFGTVVLSTFSANFRRIEAESYALDIARGVVPLDLQDVARDCDVRAVPLLRELLVFDPARRPKMSLVSSRLLHLA